MTKKTGFLNRLNVRDLVSVFIISLTQGLAALLVENEILKLLLVGVFGVLGAILATYINSFKSVERPRFNIQIMYYFILGSILCFSTYVGYFWCKFCFSLDMSMEFGFPVFLGITSMYVWGLAKIYYFPLRTFRTMVYFARKHGEFYFGLEGNRKYWLHFIVINSTVYIVILIIGLDNTLTFFNVIITDPEVIDKNSFASSLLQTDFRQNFFFATAIMGIVGRNISFD